MQYRRAKISGGTYFFTVVTYNRKKILCIPENIDLLREVFSRVMSRHPFKIDAMAVMPDHIHCIWTLPHGDCDFSARWRLIKGNFSRKCAGRVEHRKTRQNNTSRSKKNEKTVWQRRFWEHTIRDDQDLMHHVEYIHYNPVRHGMVKSPGDWEYSSFHRYVRDGVYDQEWGAGIEIKFESTVGHE